MLSGKQFAEFYNTQYFKGVLRYQVDFIDIKYIIPANISAYIYTSIEGKIFVSLSKVDIL